jgi:hypothetical protein
MNNLDTHANRTHLGHGLLQVADEKVVVLVEESIDAVDNVTSVVLNLEVVPANLGQLLVLVLHRRVRAVVVVSLEMAVETLQEREV